MLLTTQRKSVCIQRDTFIGRVLEEGSRSSPEESEGESVYEMEDRESPSTSDREELLRAGSSSPSSEQQTHTCSAKDAPEQGRSPGALELALTGLALTLSATALMVLFPAYARRTHATPLMYLLPATGCVLALLLAASLLLRLTRVQGPRLSRCPIPFRRLCEAGLSYGTGCLLVAYAQVEGRVPCHLQDPLKAVVVLLAMLYYFFLCKKMLGLRKLFAASVMAVGLFIAADYGLCDEFKCRGAESRIESSWPTRVGWTVVYLFGLGLFTLHFTLMEEHFIQRPVGALYVSLSGSLLSTVSRMVSREEEGGEAFQSTSVDLASNLPMHHSDTQPSDQLRCPSVREKTRTSSIVTALWIQTFTWLLLLFVGTLHVAFSFIRGSEYSAIMWNNTINGMRCHVPQWGDREHVRHLVNTLPAAAMAPLRSAVTPPGPTPDLPTVIHTATATDQLHYNTATARPLLESESSMLNALKDLSTFEESIMRTPKRQLLEHKLHTRHKRLDTPIIHQHHKHENTFERMRAKIGNHPKRRRTIFIQKQLHLGSEHNKRTVSSLDNKSNIHTKNKLVNAIKLNRTSNTMLHETTNAKEKILNSTNIRREKRTSDQTNAMGFKIIQPTDSILQGHIITNKLKPDLVGHVILNKTSFNINGHEITFKQDLFIREHDPLPAKMHRQHRGRIDLRFVVVQNATPGDNTTRVRSVRQSPIRQNENAKTNRTNSRNTTLHTDESPRFLRFRRDALYNDSTDVENFFKNIDRFESDHKLKDMFHDFDMYRNSKNEDVVKYEAIGTNQKPRDGPSQAHHVVYAITKLDSEGCGNIYIYGWTVCIAYTIFSISSIRYLILCQSSVFTIAMMSPALPLTGVWWSIFSQNQDGSLVLQPGLSGELICALLGLPIIILGLVLLFKAHLFQRRLEGISDKVIFSRSSNNSSTSKICGEDVMTYELTDGTHAPQPRA